jgi:hypothetical protein
MAHFHFEVLQIVNNLHSTPQNENMPKKIEIVKCQTVKKPQKGRSRNFRATFTQKINDNTLFNIQSQTSNFLNFF